MSLLLDAREPAIIVKFDNLFNLSNFFMESILLKIWNFSKCPISCANTANNASYDSAYFSNPVDIKSLFSSLMYALGASSKRILKSIFFLYWFAFVIRFKISFTKISVS